MPWLLKTHPKVAADPAMYCPRVRSMPFGPGPKRTMLVKPGLVSIPHCMQVYMKRTEDEANDQTNSYANCQSAIHVVSGSLRRTSTHHATHLHCLLLAKVLNEGLKRRMHTLVECGGAMRAASGHSSNRNRHLDECVRR